MLTTAWQTEEMGLPSDMQAPFMRNVKLPSLPAYPPSGVRQDSFIEFRLLLRFQPNSVFVSLGAFTVNRDLANFSLYLYLY